MLKFLANFGLLCILGTNILSQPSREGFISPLNIPLFLSGNYGELRSTHFHSGIDLKTQGVVGKPVLASADGYVSRINIQSGAYGNSLYLTHANGYTTVYAHLDRFMPALQKYVTDRQYQQQSFEIELFPDKTMFPFRQGEIIGYSGNTGRSGGPHLHFEIRKSDSQVPLNALLFSLPVADTQPPSFKTLYLYEYTGSSPISNAQEKRSSFKATKRNDSSYDVKETIVIDDPFFGFGTEIYDFLNGSTNECGIYTLQLTIDSLPFYAFTIDAIPFEKARYVNAHMDYDLKINQEKSVHRLFLLPNNKLPIYTYKRGNNLLSMNNDSLHRAEIIVTDAYGNQSKLTFSFAHTGFGHSISTWSDSLNFVSWNKGAVYSSNRLNIRIPPEALYQDIIFEYAIIPGAPQALSDTFSIFRTSEALHSNIWLEVPVDESSVPDAGKLMFGRVNGSNLLIAAGGEYKDGMVITSTRNFGKYVLVCDSVAPVITPVQYSKEKKYVSGEVISFSILDDFSGLDTYQAQIDGSWALLKYDAKSNTLSYSIDDSRLVSGKQHPFLIIASDAKGNRSEFSGSFNY
jgi:murein DD-endopeptidase MepM/ murein hydrolase activator NlpD